MATGRYTRGRGKASAIFSTRRYRDATGGLIGTFNLRADTDPTAGREPDKEIRIGRSLLKMWRVRLRRGKTGSVRAWIVQFGKKWRGIVEVCSEAPIPRAFRRGQIVITCGR